MRLVTRDSGNQLWRSDSLNGPSFCIWYDPSVSKWTSYVIFLFLWRPVLKKQSPVSVHGQIIKSILNILIQIISSQKSFQTLHFQPCKSQPLSTQLLLLFLSIIFLGKCMPNIIKHNVFTPSRFQCWRGRPSWIVSGPCGFPCGCPNPTPRLPHRIPAPGSGWIFRLRMIILTSPPKKKSFMMLGWFHISSWKRFFGMYVFQELICRTHRIYQVIGSGVIRVLRD